MNPASYLVDTSALFRLLTMPSMGPWEEEITAGRLAVCPAVELEFLYSVRSLADRLAKKRALAAAFGWVAMSESAFRRAAEVQERLTENGLHRGASPVGLLIAATAERFRMSVLTADRDFLAVAQVTSQRVELLGIEE